ncbi:MAG: LPS-assembly protein LptD [Notoacmeibacter sp.]|nr:LPS-assembly protein LptD [Notoacmeibacter sp.]MCC0033117.1 LPS-assembly protein LptD [Brucellaceae bacterium]
MTVTAARLAGATALGLLATLALIPASPLQAQDLSKLSGKTDPNAQMLLEADTLVYDNDNQVVRALGSVQIDYDGSKLVAREVIYNQKTRRVRAVGNVELVEKDGNRIYADEMDVTDDFGNGFVNALRIETTDNTRFAAESAERSDGNVTTFNNGVYTACEPCEEKPDKAPIWRVKAKRIIWNGQEKTVRFKDASFELFGMPIAYMPSFSIADPTVKRKTGFLFPSFSLRTELGFGTRLPFYIALADTYDLLLSPTYYTKQGFLGEAEFRQRFDNGRYMLKMAGIQQNEPGAFDINTVDRSVKTRYMVGTTGKFDINPRWALGWDILAQSDKNFSHAYSIGNFANAVHRSEIWLKGLNDRNHFDLRFMKFQVQEAALDSNAGSRNSRQPWVLPNFDYTRVEDDVAGGQLTLRANSQVLSRQITQTANALTEKQILNGAGNPVLGTGIYAINRIPGLAGTNGRASVEAEWKRNTITDGGFVITSMLAARGDGIFANLNTPSQRAVGYLATNEGWRVSKNDAWFRGMATAGLEVRYPILFNTGSASHILEPVGQLFIRPDAPYQGVIGIPNEDAQSLVFDATNLFERDKFSGWDRIEGGTRANLGLRYSGAFANGWTAQGIFGQSFHLAGRNPYAQPDFLQVGAASGLETSRSDYVGMMAVSTPWGLTTSVSARFDEKDFRLRRLQTDLIYASKLGTASLRYTDIQAQPKYGFTRDRKEVAGALKVNLTEDWSVFGGAAYDLVSKTLVRDSIGFAYDDECFTFQFSYGHKRQTYAPKKVSQQFGLFLSFRTIGDFGKKDGLKLDSLTGDNN